MAYDFVKADSEALTAGDVLDTSPDFTVAATITPDIVTARSMVISKWDATGINERSFLFEINSDGTLRVFVSTDGLFQSGNVVSSVGTLTAGVTVRVMFVMDGSNTDMLLYIDGAVDGTNTSGPATVHSGSGELIIGAQDDTDGVNNVVFEFDGDISEVGHWNRALSAAEAAVDAASKCPLSNLRGLDAYWPLVRELHDLGSGGNNLSLVGTPTVSSHMRVIRPPFQILQFPPVAAAGGATPWPLVDGGPINRGLINAGLSD